MMTPTPLRNGRVRGVRPPDLKAFTFNRWRLMAAITVFSASVVASDQAAAEGVTAQVETFIAQRCAGCHGSAVRPSAAPRSSEVFPPLARLAIDRKRVVPGQPDMSPLFWAIFDGHAGTRPTASPRRRRADARSTTKSGPDNAIAAVRTWIAQLAGTRTGSPTSVIGDVVVEGLKTSYRISDTITFRIRAKRDCRVTAINVDVDGIATVVFPNEFARESKLSAGSVIALPPADTPLAFRARKTGRERLVVFCALGRGAVLGIRHRFDLQRFTTLGDWEAFLARAPGGIKPSATSRAHRGSRRGRPAMTARFGAVSVVEFDIR